ncbi:hypothetical protein M409DRAFT_29991 [Zasmidium cellare ATCC 36951]|uniref:Heterokaryon incompatibility domain-containing protein n=1 Tax=Zasmidium cellare ATCC 36951 TaxID=1080233 RepID=A0A6A6BXJ3_ZASCE|nr:uncharacterized protein M409DRAFT_29991 [Zasmidium cellare ATCC 36951]KAF2159517.1 hypothetical protein M409DRAFT_29991 [Zasmidium cellare ATCC 36951]
MNLTRWKSPPGSSPGSELLDFAYKPLRGENSIRLVKIKPGTGHTGIAIDLIDSFVPLLGQRTHQEYDALSYTWGEGLQSKSITCNGRRFHVTEALREALRYFRDPIHDVILWIDQISICQKWTLERNKQVKMMGDIFSGARKVLVWLGGHYDDSRKGMQLADQLLRVCRGQGLTTLDRTQLRRYGMPEVGNTKWKALEGVLLRPWFYRTWVVQEVVLNANVELTLGDDVARCSITWDELEDVVSLLEGPAPRDWQLDLTMSAWRLPFSRINRIRKRHQRAMMRRTNGAIAEMEGSTALFEEPESNDNDEYIHGQDDLDLLELLLMSRDLGATDPLDKIYALLGLAEHNINPNYDASPEQLFNEFALHIIGDVTSLVPGSARGAKISAAEAAVRKALVLLSCAGTPNQERHVPSWTPDWTADLTAKPLVFDRGYCAGGDTFEIDWDFETGLQLCGRLVDTVRRAGSVHLRYDPNLEGAALIEEWWQEACGIAQYRSSRFPSRNRAFRAMCRDLKINDQGYYHPDGVDSTERPTPRRRRSLLDETDLSLSTSIENPRQTLTLGPTRGRVLFSTTTGYIGLAPHGTVEGDLIYVVLGANVPFVLRPLTGHDFTLIGEAYVQGIMRGEFMEMQHTDTADDIYIR